MSEAKKTWKAPLAFRGGLCCAAVAVQALIQSDSLSYERVRTLMSVLLYAGIALLALGLAALWQARQKSLYLCVALDCAGLSASFFWYWDYVSRFAGDRIDQLKLFILVPYLVCFCLSWGIWLISRYTTFRLKGWRKLAPGQRATLKQILRGTLCAGGILFTGIGAYLLAALGSVLLGIWAFFTAGLLFFSFGAVGTVKSR